MLGVHYLQSSPTTYVMRYKNGELVDSGLGLSLWYFGPGSTIVRISQASQDVPFVFEQQTLDFQDVTVQGNLTFRVISPQRLAEQLDFSVDKYGCHKTDDPSQLRERMVRQIQAQTNRFTRDQSLREMLTASNLLAEYLAQDPSVLSTASSLGLEVESIQVLSVRPDPEMAAAMQAEAREQLLQQADEAVHERRKTAIELESEIQEKELNNQRSMQEKKQEVRQAELDADVAIEKGRTELVSQKAENDAKEAEVQIETTRALLDSMRDVDWRTMVASNGNVDSKQLIAMAFGELAENARKIGRLDISPDLLSKLMDEPSQNGSTSEPER